MSSTIRGVDNIDSANIALKSSIGLMQGYAFYSTSSNIPTTDFGKVIELTGSTSLTMTLPTPVNNVGGVYRVINSNSNAATIATSAGTFYGAPGQGVATVTMQYGYQLDFVSDGTNWKITRGNSLGEYQTWQDVTASRTLGTTYTNTTGKPIQIGFSAGGSAGGTQFVATISGLTHVMGFGTGWMEGRFDLIIPNGATYSIAWNSGSSNYSAWKWRELR